MSWSPYLILTVCVCVCGMGFPGGSDGEESICHRRDSGSIPRLGRSPGEGKGYPLHYSGLENSMDSIVHGVTKSGTQLSNFHICIYIKLKKRTYTFIYTYTHIYTHTYIYITEPLCCTHETNIFHLKL